MIVKKFIFFLLCAAFILASCKKSTSSTGPSVIPVVTTAAMRDITSSTAVSTVSISEIDNSFIASGIVWSAQPHPVLATGQKAINFNRETKYADTLKNLIGGITYYARAFLTTKDSVYYGNEESFTTVVPPIAIGNNYAGGIIFYIDSTKMHGLVAATSDLGATLPWDNGNDKYISSIFITPTAIGTGAANTTAIISKLGTTPAGYAALSCHNLALNGYKDWYLPSKDELHLMKTNLYDAGLGNFQAFGYWSSSTDNVSDFYAWAQLFTDNNPVLTNIATTEYVRAVRSF